MREKAKFYCALFCVSFLVVGCSSQPGPAEQPPADASAPSPESEGGPEVPEPSPRAAEETPAPNVPAEPPAQTSTPATEPRRPAPAEDETGPVTPEQPRPQSTDSTVEPAPSEVAPTPPSPDAAPQPQPSEPSAPVVVDIGGPVEVGATKPGLSRIGADKCKICHKVQFTSWAETAHASRTPPLDCEGCHGPGSEYKSKAVMEDPAKARSAGLVDPDRTFCSQCHSTGWTDDLLERAHAHKVEDS